MTQSFFVRLTHERVLAVRGPDAKKFLQGQLTCNLDYLDDGASSLGARCTPKGRMISSFRIVKDGDGYLLAMSGDLLDAQLADLKKYGVFSKVTLAEEAEWTRIGLYAPDAPLVEVEPAFLHDAGATAVIGNRLYLALDAHRGEVWVRGAKADDVLTDISATFSEAALNDWLLAQIRAGVGQVFGETRELFIPQMINLQAVGGVSFKKGCYTGQEIVARMQYLGKLKRRLYRLSADTNVIAPPGTPLFSPVHGSSVGEVVLAATTPSGVELLAVLQDDAAQDGNVHLFEPDGTALNLLELPYTLDRDQEIRR
ncbi:CAF17-like 4Fe-4S cluster assembly/insertion protein YgfZ [Pseudomonas sp. Marseille-QA0892]